MKAMTEECLDGHQSHVDHAGKSTWGTRGLSLGHTGVVTATLEVTGTRDMGAAGMTVNLGDMDMDTDGPETTVASRVVMTVTREEIIGIIMTTEM
jgi:hypothetical protein